MEMPLCDNKECKGYQKTPLEEGETPSGRAPDDYDPILYCDTCMTTYEIDDFYDPDMAHMPAYRE
jgi:hypothetical protein